MSFKLFARVVVVSALTISIVSAYNPDQDAQTDKIIRMHNYECQNHDVRTEDDYLLTLHRIPRGRKPNTKKKTPVYLQHGLLGSSADWIIQGPERSLAYKLADEGHDVWLGNVRGNTYSRLHASISPDTKEFWDFSFHEMGVFDVPATIDYILNKTGSEQVYYIGHSMGTTMFYVLCSVRPEYNAKIKMMFSLAPIAFMSHAGTPLRALTNHLETYELILETLKSNGELFRRSSLMDWLMKTLCEQNILQARFCEEVIFMICGTDIKEYDLDLQPILLSHTPAGTSIKTLVHYGQLIKSGYFREYDYLKFDNREKYHNDTPPNYDLSRITAPVSLHYSANDLLANVTDVNKLHALLPHAVAADEVEDKDFNHLDFIYSKDVNKLLNNNVIDRIYRSESGLPPPPKRNHAEMIIPRRSEYPEFNDFSTSSEHQEAYPMDEEILDNVVNLKTMAEKRLETINEKAKLAINRNLKGFKRLLMLELKKHSNGADSYAENKLIKWKNEADVY